MRDSHETSHLVELMFNKGTHINECPLCSFWKGRACLNSVCEAVGLGSVKFNSNLLWTCLSFNFLFILLTLELCTKLKKIGNWSKSNIL